VHSTVTVCVEWCADVTAGTARTAASAIAAVRIFLIVLSLVGLVGWRSSLTAEDVELPREFGRARATTDPHRPLADQPIHACMISSHRG
jgi:hypothetical protein